MGSRGLDQSKIVHRVPLANPRKNFLEFFCCQKNPVKVYVLYSIRGLFFVNFYSTTVFLKIKNSIFVNLRGLDLKFLPYVGMVLGSWFWENDVIALNSCYFMNFLSLHVSPKILGGQKTLSYFCDIILLFLFFGMFLFCVLLPINGL